jgi:hypothetical protein
MENYKVVSFGQNRFAVANADNKIIDDAQGYGYKTAQNAHKVLNWKFKGGNKKNEERKSKYVEWKKENKESFSKAKNLYEDYLISNCKSVAYGETTLNEIWECVEKNLNI